ncbi:MAG: antibiotic ABC transporter ATP-binding protein [Bacteroidetes bacterium HGW-Bacteroidetes-19]|nr:MAG: antibiotic ABC transporter ATP-binding protein [Bacteroidetes bacterium HGW-Bacteroidetes-19]
MRKRAHFLKLMKPYSGKLLAVSFFNLLSVSVTIITFLLIEPFIKLLFQGNLENVSLLSRYFIEIISRFIDLNSLSTSMFALSLLIILLYLLKNVFLATSLYLMAPIKSDVLRKLRNAIYYKILILPLSFFTTGKRGDIISRAVNDTQEVEFTIMRSIQVFLTEPLTILIYVTTLSIISPYLTIFVAILLPVTGFLISLASRKLRKRTGKAKERLGDIFTHVEESLSGLKIIKGFSAQEYSENVFQYLNHRFTRLQKRIYRKVDLASPLSEFLGVTVVMIILVFGGLQVINGTGNLNAGLFIVYIALFTQIINPAKNIATAFSNFRRGMAALDRISEILDEDEIILEKEHPLPISNFKQQIEYKNVSFSYSHREVISDLSLTVQKGEVIAIVGASGSGKSTLVDLLPRFYDVTKGEILIDGTNIEQFVIDDLRSLFAIVSQDVVLFNDSVTHNITYGLETYNQEDVVKAAKLAYAYDFIMELPQQFDTQIGDRGLTLSGGQRQRISIARALLRETPILIFDEATSALDSESEKLVQEAIDNMMKERTVFVIAHRLSTIQNADRIIVLEKGKIVEIGNHKTLMDKKGKYWEMSNIYENR